MLALNANCYMPILSFSASAESHEPANESTDDESPGNGLDFYLCRMMVSHQVDAGKILVSSGSMLRTLMLTGKFLSTSWNFRRK
jgi:hypothetical protein